MKVNSIILITFCLLQFLNCATVGLNEQSLKNAAIKTLKYERMFHQDSVKLNDKDNLHELKFNYSPLTSDNIKFRFDGLYIYIKFFNLNASIKGDYILFSHLCFLEYFLNLQLNYVILIGSKYLLFQKRILVMVNLI